MARSGFKKGVSGIDANVDTGPGSKKGRGDGHPGGSGRVSNRSGHEELKGTDGVDRHEKQHDVKFAEGGDTHMFGLQEAGSRTSADKSPSTGKPDSSGPGEKFAEGGRGKMFGYNPSVPARSGITSAR